MSGERSEASGCLSTVVQLKSLRFSPFGLTFYGISNYFFQFILKIALKREKKKNFYVFFV
jgi:hypothetical protein